MNYKLLLQYDGTRYDGWQKQGNTANTIQGRLEAVLSALAGEAVAVHGAGRTDAGVHALGQVASVRLPLDLPAEELRRRLNAALPDDIAVADVRPAGERFHARLNAVGKTYRYAVRLGDVPDVFCRKYQFRVAEPLDLAAMERAAALLTGRQDYRSFCSNRKMTPSVWSGAAATSRLPSTGTASSITWCAFWWAPFWRWAGGSGRPGICPPSSPPGTVRPPVLPRRPRASLWCRWTITDRPWFKNAPALSEGGRGLLGA